MTESPEQKRLVRHWKLARAASVDPDITKSDIAVLMAVIDRMGSNETSWPGLLKIAADAGTNDRTALRSINRLCDRGYLVRESGGKGKSNRYREGRPTTVTRAGTDTQAGTDSQTGTGADDGTDTQAGELPTARPVPVPVCVSVESASLNLLQESTSKEQPNADAFELSADDSKPSKAKSARQSKKSEDDAVCKIVIDAYHRLLPRCRRVFTLTTGLRRSILRAHGTVRDQIRSGVWGFEEYDQEWFWGAYFTECKRDPWLRGEVPHPDQPRWRQNLLILLKEERFAALVDAAIDEIEREGRSEPEPRAASAEPRSPSSLPLPG